MADRRKIRFLLYKLLGHLLMPLPAGILLAGLALLLLPHGADNLVACAILAGLWALGTPALGHRLLGRIERSVNTPPLADLPQADAVVSLSGGFPWRDLRALDLHRLGKAPVVVFSGQVNPTNKAALDQLIALARLSPAELLIEQQSRTTAEGGRALAALARQRGWQRILLVSDGYHLARAMAHYGQGGLVVIPVKAMAEPTPEANPAHQPRLVPPLGERLVERLVNLIPGPWGLAHSQRALRERIGALLFRGGVRVQRRGPGDS
jgi:uncharacterized SAM-binding protein YcdF (DUF218 family)